MKRLIALDLDGTLEDSRDDMTAAARRVRAQLGLPARDDAALRPWVNGGMDQLYAKCFDDFIGQSRDEVGGVESRDEVGGVEGRDEVGGVVEARSRVATVRQAYEADYMANVAVATHLYDGIDAALRELAQLGTLACVTNKPERISRHLLDRLGVGELFGTVVGGDSCAQAKPHPMMLSAACERLQLDPRDTAVFMIGDTAADMQLARSFGAKGIWVAWGYVASIDEPHHGRASKPSELRGLIES